MRDSGTRLRLLLHGFARAFDLSGDLSGKSKLNEREIDVSWDSKSFYNDWCRVGEDIARASKKVMRQHPGDTELLEDELREWNRLHELKCRKLDLMDAYESESPFKKLEGIETEEV